MQEVCPKNHKITWECWKGSVTCSKCEAEAKRREAQRVRDHKLDLQRQTNEQIYAEKLAQLDEGIAHERRLQKEHADELDRQRVLQQRRKDLANAKVATRNATAIKVPDRENNASTEDRSQKAVAQTDEKATSPSDSVGTGVEKKNELPEISKAKKEWDYQKCFENADNEHMDALMEMIGLESVKEEFLKIKTTIDTCIRQSSNIKNERFGATLLGNPGTGTYMNYAFATFHLHC
jgi:hypothetical protein